MVCCRCLSSGQGRHIHFTAIEEQWLLFVINFKIFRFFAEYECSSLAFEYEWEYLSYWKNYFNMNTPKCDIVIWTLHPCSWLPEMSIFDPSGSPSSTSLSSCCCYFHLLTHNGMFAFAVVKVIKKKKKNCLASCPLGCCPSLSITDPCQCCSHWLARPMYRGEAAHLCSAACAGLALL